MSLRRAASTLARGVLLLALVTATFGTTYALGVASAAAPRADEPRTTVEDVSDEVMCPSCDTTLDNSSSPAAERMRTRVEELVDEGRTKDEVKDQLVADYGGDESVLAVPRPSGLGLYAWLVPMLVAAAALVTGVTLVVRWRRRPPPRRPDDAPGAHASSA